ncbi:MAG: ATP-binding protein, partial [bacterium]
MESKSFFQKPVDELTFEDIQYLVDEKIPESYNLDYKRDNYEKSKTHELAKDISAFANTQGGYLIIGVDEDKDANGVTIPGDIIGIEKEEDIEKRIMDRVITSIMPHPYVTPKIIDIPENADRIILVLYIPQSHDSLHMVVVKKKNCYYKRYHDQNIPMDEYEVRTRYSLLSKSEGDIDSHTDEEILKMLGRCKSTMKGSLVLVLSPVFADYKFKDFKIARSFDDWDHYKHPKNLMLPGPSTKPRLGYFEKANDRLDPSCILQIGTNCNIRYISSHVFYPRSDVRYFDASETVYELFHILNIALDFYSKIGFFGYLRITVQISELYNSRL